ncbi:hypothetical protein ACFO8O_03350 [Hephaestia sp. GCM10023244]|uniref:hypothetical protein n=1 Tax=unclassified Hephaestia TaxID=2631281 RepID=UPI0020773285|nr:hypothetical protein [Hephaestia sp. MAHUQ-44]MCM8730005.1 hypothetical protein [Hephaestia sp. MAHUQ-44]
MAKNDTSTPDTAAADKTPKTKTKAAAKTVKKEAAKVKDSAARTFKDNAGKLSGQAGEKARDYAAQGKAKASGALEEFSKLMTNAAGSVDEKLGAQYGDYARSAAQSLSSFSQSLDSKDIDQLLDEARNFVRKSPAIAIGTAAAVGFVLARLVKSGFDTDTADDA